MRQKLKIPESELVAMLQSKDKKVMSILYDQYSAALYGVVLRVIKNEVIAQDVMQEAFLKIWNYGDKYTADKGTLFTWMLNVARNTAIDKLRSKEFNAINKADEISTFVSGIELRNPVEQNIDAIGLTDVVNTLKPEYKNVVNLLYYQGFTQEEASKELDIPLGTVKTRIKSAINQLRNLVS